MDLRGALEVREWIFGTGARERLAVMIGDRLAR
jgi:hypothetical protein